MTEFIYTPISACELRPRDVFRGVVREPGDPDLTVILVDRFNDHIYAYCEGQDDAIVFTKDAPLELRVDVDAYHEQVDALHEERLQQEAG